jgi:hypothetical protein
MPWVEKRTFWPPRSFAPLPRPANSGGETASTFLMVALEARPVKGMNLLSPRPSLGGSRTRNSNPPPMHLLPEAVWSHTAAAAGWVVGAALGMVPDHSKAPAQAGR